MKEIIKRILPKKWVEKHSLYKLKRRYMQHFEHDILRYNTYSGLWVGGLYGQLPHPGEFRRGDL